MELSKEVRELYRDAREEICCDECLSKDSNICPCNEVVRLRRLVDDVVKSCTNTAKSFLCATCLHYKDCPYLRGCDNINKLTELMKGENENERQIES